MIKPNQLSNTIVASIIFVLVTNTLFAQLAGTSFSDAKKTKSAKLIYVYDGVSGFADRNSSGEVSGFLVDIMSKFGEHLQQSYGIVVQSEFYRSKGGDFQVFMSDLKQSSGGVFGLSNISIKEERKKVYAFSKPYLQNASVLLTHSSVPTLQSIEDIPSAFSGMKAYSLENSTYSKRLVAIKEAYYPEMQIEFLSSGDDILNSLTSDKQAFAFLDLNYYLEVLKNKAPIKRHPIGDKKDDQYGILMPKGSDWQPIIDEFFTDFIGSTEYSEIISKHLGSSALRLIYSVSN